MAFDSSGNLSVGNGTSGTISKFDSAGNLVFSWNSVQPNFLLVAPTAVPEPSAIAVAGLATAGLAGFVLRGRHTRCRLSHHCSRSPVRGPA
ncbi:MAG: PEP-CTERM sorting domain-containing protein [Planctomycetes bacterium]|nr:PEP-CTERM sorting domain-containing protein [Planctomycetota bacterium]